MLQPSSILRFRFKLSLPRTPLVLKDPAKSTFEDTFANANTEFLAASPGSFPSCC
jgi:hypothetical protein